MEGVYRFLARVYRLISGDISEDVPTEEQLRLLHFTIKKACFVHFVCPLITFVIPSIFWQTKVLQQCKQHICIVHNQKSSIVMC